mgnify:CR=1 FL=1
MKDNPKAALAALTSPAKLTLGKVALLCRLDSPILSGKIDDMPKCLTAIFVVENDFADSVANFSRIEDLALIAYGGISACRRSAATSVARLKKKLGNGWVAELVEWLCRTYGYRPDYVLGELPAVQGALLWRCWVQGPGGSETGTLLEDELAFETWGRKP